MNLADISQGITTLWSLSGDKNVNMYAMQGHETSNKDFIVFTLPADTPFETVCNQHGQMAVNFNIFSCRNTTSLFTIGAQIRVIFDNYAGVMNTTEIKRFEYSTSNTLINPDTPEVLQMNIAYNVWYV
jgi:hypothetical protein